MIDIVVHAYGYKQYGVLKIDILTVYCFKYQKIPPKPTKTKPQSNQDFRAP